MKDIIKALLVLLVLIIGGFILYIGGIIIVMALQHGPIQYMFTSALWIAIPVMIGVIIALWMIIKAFFKGLG